MVIRVNEDLWRNCKRLLKKIQRSFVLVAGNRPKPLSTVHFDLRSYPNVCKDNQANTLVAYASKKIEAFKNVPDLLKIKKRCPTFLNLRKGTTLESTSFYF